MLELRTEGCRGSLCKLAGEICPNDLSIAVCAGVSFIKVVGKSFAVEVASTVLVRR